MTFTLCSCSHSVPRHHDRRYGGIGCDTGGTSTSLVSATDLYPWDSAVGEWLATYEVVQHDICSPGVLQGGWKYPV